MCSAAHSAAMRSWTRAERSARLEPERQDTSPSRAWSASTSRAGRGARGEAREGLAHRGGVGLREQLLDVVDLAAPRSHHRRTARARTAAHQAGGRASCCDLGMSLSTPRPARRPGGTCADALVGDALLARGQPLKATLKTSAPSRARRAGPAAPGERLLGRRRSRGSHCRQHHHRQLPARFSSACSRSRTRPVVVSQAASRWRRTSRCRTRRRSRRDVGRDGRGGGS